MKSGILLGGVDLTDASSAKSAFDRVRAQAGRIDALVNIAGGFRWETIGEGAADTWDLMYALNLKTAIVACQAALPHLLESPGGGIVNIGANAALKAGVGMGAYAASKAGVAKLTEALAEELKGRVTVNAVLPSIIDTPANRAEMPGADFSKWVGVEDLAHVIMFLVSKHARAVTGALIPVTGLV
jgi:NAD(P)-dependent dehydrogenase (short-subunit alcohol dehydrogenase family)